MALLFTINLLVCLLILFWFCFVSVVFSWRQGCAYAVIIYFLSCFFFFACLNGFSVVSCSVVFLFLNLFSQTQLLYRNICMFKHKRTLND